MMIKNEFDNNNSSSVTKSFSNSSTLFQRRPKGLAFIVDFYSSFNINDISINLIKNANLKKEKRVFEMNSINSYQYFLDNQMSISAFNVVLKNLFDKATSFSLEFEKLDNSNRLKN